MEFKTIIITISSLIALSLHTSANLADQPIITSTEANVFEEENSIVIDEMTSSTKIVNENGSTLKTLVDEQNSNSGLINSNLFSPTGSCICVPYYLCSDNKTIITDGANLIDIRTKPPHCNSYLDVCCHLPLNHTETADRNSKYRNGCGRRSVQGIGLRISGDINNEAQYGEFPWMIAILRIEKVNENISMNIYQCGGSLIHPQVIMTAAHCVINQNVTNLYARAGEWDTQTKKEHFPHVDQPIIRAIIHERYYSGGLFNDIALLVTETPFNLTEHINTVCLPPQGLVEDDVTCTATGWGKNEFGRNGTYQVILKKVDLPMVPRNLCERQLRETRLGKFFRLHESFICAGGEAGRDTCKGDGGGPLACPILNKGQQGTSQETKYQQNGIIAWGIKCAEANIPGVYVNVALFRNWIDNWMKILRFDSSYYII